MRSFRLSRRQHHGDDEGEPLEKLRRRCAAGAIGFSCCYMAVMILTVVRPNALSTPAAFGLLILFGTPSALFALGAVLTWAVARLPQMPDLQEIQYERQAEDLKWAMGFGAEMANAFRAAPPGRSDGR